MIGSHSIYPFHLGVGGGFSKLDEEGMIFFCLVKRRSEENLICFIVSLVFYLSWEEVFYGNSMRGSHYLFTRLVLINSLNRLRKVLSYYFWKYIDWFCQHVVQNYLIFKFCKNDWHKYVSKFDKWNYTKVSFLSTVSDLMCIGYWFFEERVLDV